MITLTTRVLMELEPSLAKLPPAVHQEVVTMFRRPSANDCVKTLAARSGITVRSINRHFHATGLRPSTLIQAARVCAVHSIVARAAFGQIEPGYATFGPPNVVRKHCKRLTDLHGTAFRRADPETVAQLVLARLERAA